MFGICRACGLRQAITEAQGGRCTKCSADVIPENLLGGDPKRATERDSISARSDGPPSPATSQLSPPPSTKNIGRYKDLAKLGEGGMGVVYKAWDPEGKRHVAIKLMTLSDDSGAAERFAREARTAAGLSHPNIVKILEIRTDEEPPYIVMEYVEGQTLEKIWSSREPGTEDEHFKQALEWIRVAAHALGYVHRKKKVHRDMNPRNLMVDGEGSLKLLDFGLARDVEPGDTVTTTGKGFGTPPYMSPEQFKARRDDIGPTTDVWALGVILYRVAVGELPFQGDRAQISYKVLHEDPSPPRRMKPSLPRDLETIVMKCLESSPLDRYQDASRLEEDLRRYLDGTPIAAKPPGFMKRLSRKIKKRKGVAMAAAGGILAVGILAGILLPKLGSARKEAAEATKKNELQKRLGDLHNRIIDADSFFYIPADNILAKLREVEDALEQLERIAVDQGDHALDIWKMLGKGWHFLGTLDRAEHVLRKAHQRAPNDDRVNFYLGRVYLQQSWLAGLTGGPISEEARRKQEKSLAEKALVHLRKLSSAKGRMGEIDHHLARAYEAFSARRKEEARRLCEEGQKLFNTKMGREEYQIILAMLATGQDRISACQEALSVRHHFPWASFIRGAERLEREEWTIANGDFDSALRIWKHFVPARINRAYALFRSGNHTAATKECYEASLVKRSSDQDDLLYNVWGSAQHALSKYQDALTSFDKALKANPKLVEAQYNIGQVKHSLGKLDDAIEDFKKAVDIERRYTDSHWKIGNIYLHRGEFAKAVDWFTHGVDQTDAMRKQHPLEHFYCNRGLASAKLGHSKEAISDWSAAIRTNPECAEAYVNRLQARLATQQSEHLDAEVADCTEALNGKGRRFALICRAHARAHKREYGPAIADFREGLKLIADDVSIVAMAYFTYVAYYNLACCYARVDQSDNAFTGLRRAIELGFKDVKQLSEELDLQSLRADPRWQGVLDLLGK